MKGYLQATFEIAIPSGFSSQTDERFDDLFPAIFGGDVLIALADSFSHSPSVNDPPHCISGLTSAPYFLKISHDSKSPPQNRSVASAF